MSAFRPRNPTPARAFFRHREDLLNTSSGSIELDFDDDTLSLADDFDNDDDDCDLAFFMAPVVTDQSPVDRKSRRFQLPYRAREHTPFSALSRPRNPTPARASAYDFSESVSLSTTPSLKVSMVHRRPRNPTPSQALRSSVAKKLKVVRSELTTSSKKTTSPRYLRTPFSRQSSSGFASSSPLLCSGISTTPIFAKTPSPFPSGCWRESLIVDCDSPFVFSSSLNHQNLARFCA